MYAMTKMEENAGAGNVRNPFRSGNVEIENAQ